MRDSSELCVARPQRTVAAVTRLCTTAARFIILIPVMELFTQSVEYLYFRWLENDELYQRGHVYPLDEVLFHQKSWLSYIFEMYIEGEAGLQ